MIATAVCSDQDCCGIHLPIRRITVCTVCQKDFCELHFGRHRREHRELIEHAKLATKQKNGALRINV